MAWSLAAIAGCAQPIVPCPLADAKSGSIIVLRSEVFSGAHDTFLRPQGCDEKVVLIYGDDPSLQAAKVPIKRDEAFHEYERLVGAEEKPAGVTVCKQCWKYRVTADFTGKLEVAQSAGWKKDPKTGKVIGIEGFGHPLPFTRYRLVVSAISKVEAVDRKAPSQAKR